LLNILDPKKFHNFRTFAFRHCSPRKTLWGWQFKGATRLRELHRKLKGLMIRRLKADVLQDLPAKSRHVVLFDFARKKHKTEYVRACSDFLEWLGDKVGQGKVRRAMKAEQVVKLGYLKRLAAQLKMASVLEWIDNFIQESDRKLVVFAVHKKCIAQLRTKYKDQCVVVDGSTATNKRQLAVDKFQKDAKCRLFIGNIQAAGVGLTLTAADTVAFAELDFVPGNHTQAEDRIHRIGQKMAAQVFYFVLKNTIEERLVKILQSKMEIVKQVLDGVKDSNELDVYDLLTKALTGV
jgi:SWI/SNF-related matrix-associated actin-dependent regulator of chromatin subfamily A-like protein 1